MASYTTRRNFLKTTTGLLGMAFAGASFDFKRSVPLLSFSTLGCPDWSFETIINFAVKHSYNGIELRGIQRELDLTKRTEFSNNANIISTRKLVEGKGLKIVNLGSSAQLHHADAAERKRQIDDGKKFIDLAQQLNCPYVRVFPNNLPKEQERNATIDLIAQGLLELGDYAKGHNVKILLETHGDVVASEDLKKIMETAKHPNTGLVWDIVNMWAVTKEPPVEVYEKLKTYIWHTHIKDAKLVNGDPQYTLLGQGETPVFEAVDALYKGGYNGYYSFEWEKMWHPEIAEPEIALAEYTKTMKQHFDRL